MVPLSLAHREKFALLFFIAPHRDFNIDSSEHYDKESRKIRCHATHIYTHGCDNSYKISHQTSHVYAHKH
jgi:hypothetical protein